MDQRIQPNNKRRRKMTSNHSPRSLLAQQVDLPKQVACNHVVHHVKLHCQKQPPRSRRPTAMMMRLTKQLFLLTWPNLKALLALKNQGPSPNFTQGSNVQEIKRAEFCFLPSVDVSTYVSTPTILRTCTAQHHALHCGRQLCFGTVTH